MDIEKLKDELKDDEGYSRFVYKDTQGYLTIGYGLCVQEGVGEGMSAAQAIRQACLLRFRPIMMTTLCALMGALPMALGLGVGSELRQPLGVAIVGGLLFSQLITLFITPVLYLWFDQLSGRRRLASDGRLNPSVA